MLIFKLNVLSYLVPIELPLWIIVSLAYGLYVVIKLQGTLKWRTFTALSFAEIAATVLFWEIPGIIVMALTVFPIWLSIALKIHKVRLKKNSKFQ